MIDESIMEKIIPLPNEEDVMEEIQERLEEEGFIITNFSKGGVFYTLVRILIHAYIQMLELARKIVNSCFMRHTSGEWADIKAADYGKSRKEAKKAKGYVTVHRKETGFSLTVTQGHMFKTPPDAYGNEKKFYASGETVIHAGETEGKVLVEAECPGTSYNLLPDKITVSMIHLEGVERVANESGWLIEEGTDEETDEGLRERCANSFSELAFRTTAQKMKNAAEAVNGVLTAEIDAQHPRGQGTVDIYITGTAGEATQDLLLRVEDAVRPLEGNYEDYLVKPSEVFRQDFEVVVWIAEGACKEGVKETAEEIVMSLFHINRKELNRFYRDSLIQKLADKIMDYRTADILQPAVNVLLDKKKVIVPGIVEVSVKNVGEGLNGYA